MVTAFENAGEIIWIDNLKKCSCLKCSYLKIGSHGNAMAVSYFRRRARLRSRAHDFHYSIQKRCRKLGRYVSFNEIHALYTAPSSNSEILVELKSNQVALKGRERSFLFVVLFVLWMEHLSKANKESSKCNKKCLRTNITPNWRETLRKGKNVLKWL